LMQAGLADLQRQVPSAPWKSARTGFYLSLPHPRRIYTGLDLIPDEGERQERLEEAREAEQEPLDDTIPQRLLEKAAQLCGWHGKPSLRFVATSGHTGVAEVIHKAIEDLSSGQMEMAIVGGVDSLMEEDTLEWLGNMGRLKTPSLPDGLQPGEAGSFLSIETWQRVKARGGCALAIVQQDVCVGEESKTLLSGGAPVGIGLSSVLSRISTSTDWKGNQPLWLITDQNGEHFRAMEWGTAVVGLVASSQAFIAPILWHSAESFGDTGAASGAVSLCMAIRGFNRDYAPAKNVVVISSAEGSHRTAIYLVK